MAIYERPNEIIAYCLKPLELDPASEAYKEVVLRLQHVIKTFQLAAAKPKPVPVDFSQIRTIVINESAHGDD
jgi:hypothetical protein